VRGNAPSVMNDRIRTIDPPSPRRFDDLRPVRVFLRKESTIIGISEYQPEQTCIRDCSSLFYVQRFHRLRSLKPGRRNLFASSWLSRREEPRTCPRD
jgi:hypothetical protein